MNRMFEPYLERELNGGVQKLYKFDNGYGASVVRHEFSYGHERRLWELVVTNFNVKDDGNWVFDYDTPITNNVLGYLSDEDVNRTLKNISEL